MSSDPAVDAAVEGLPARAQAPSEHGPDAMVILDVEAGRFVWANPAAEHLFGLDRAQLRRVGPLEISPPVQPGGRPSESAAQEYIGQTLAGGRPRFEWTYQHADGRELPCEVSLLSVPAGERRLIRGTILGLGAGQEAEQVQGPAIAESAARQAAEASAARLQAMVAGLNAVVWERDPHTLRIRYINDRAEKLLGYPTVQWLGDSELWPGILHPADREGALNRVRQAIAEDVDFAMTYRARTRDGHWLWLQHLGHVARDDAGAPRALHVVLIDITEQKRRELAAALLAGVADALSQRGAVEERLSVVAGLAVGGLCERSAVWLRGDDDRYRLVAAAPAAVARRVPTVAPLAIPEELLPSLSTGRPFLVDEPPEASWRAAGADDGEDAPLAAGWGGGATVVVPLMSGGERVGLLCLSSTDPDRRYEATDLALAGELGQRIATMVDAERVAARQRQLHELTAALSAAGTVAEASAALTAGLRRYLGAAVVSVFTLGPDGQLHNVETRGYPADRQAWFATVRLTASQPVAEAVRTRSPVWLSERAALAERFPSVEPLLLDSTQAAAALPLLAQDHVVGALGVTFAAPRCFDQGERAFLHTVADQVAVALERAALADVRREMADTLQRSLLPARLPELDRLEVVTRYLPAVQGLAAGGDWFDVHRLKDGRVALAVGDIVGNGAAAAAAMGQLRSSLATLLLAGHAPAEALELLDLFADEVPGAGVCTAACLQLDPATGRLTYSRAGHPPPLVVEEEGSAFLDDGLGPALGLPGRGPRPQATTTVPPAATLVLFTDGLVESRGAALDAGLDRLAAAAVARRSMPLPDAIDGVLADLIGVGGAADDIAVIAVRLLPPPLHLDLPADPAKLSGVRREALRWAARCSIDPDTAQDLELALGEAVANSVEHAYRGAERPGRVQVTLERDAVGALMVTVVDGGTWHPPAADPGYRGRGLQIINTVAADVELHHGPDGTVLRFRLLAAPSARPRPDSPAEPAPASPESRVERSAALTTGLGPDGQRLELTGDLDLAGATAVRERLLSGLAEGDQPVLLDLSGLGFLASVGLGLLLEAARAARRHRDLRVVLPVSGPARRALDLTGLATALQPV